MLSTKRLLGNFFSSIVRLLGRKKGEANYRRAYVRIVFGDLMDVTLSLTPVLSVPLKPWINFYCIIIIISGTIFYWNLPYNILSVFVFSSVFCVAFIILNCYEFSQVFCNLLLCLQHSRFLRTPPTCHWPMCKTFLANKRYLRLLHICVLWFLQFSAYSVAVVASLFSLCS